MRLFSLNSQNVFLLFLSLFLVGCSAGRVFYGKQDRDWNQAIHSPKGELLYSLYLIGDVGEDTAQSKPVLRHMTRNLTEADQDKSGIIFLGDNVYPHGLHKKSSKYRAEDEIRLNAQLDAVREFEGEVIFTPGNHDWKDGKEKGIKYIKRQEKYIEKYLNDPDIMQPGNGCPGPTEIQLAPGLLMIVIDTQWWLHQHEKSSGEKDGCEVRSKEELAKAFKNMLKKYRDQNIVVVGHHPLYSNGKHGGNFEFKDHIFPFEGKFDNVWIPLPVIGSIHPYYRKFIGLHQDLAYPQYKSMRNELAKIMNGFDNVIYVAGHEHNLQYVHEKDIHHIISGSGSKVTKMRFNQSIDFGAESKGYSKISYYDNGEIWLAFYTLDKDTDQEKLAFRKLLYTKVGVKRADPVNVTKKSYAGMYKTVYPDSLKGAKGAKTVLLGELNRDLWTAPVTVPYLDIHYEKGGMTPIKKGGGMQTLSLRMQGGDGNQYTLRGIKKSPEFIITKKLRGTWAQSIVYDGFAGSHPYGALATPYLSEEAGIYYSDSKLVYVPKDSVLGDFLDEFGGMFCLLEQRPDDDVSDQANFGHSEKVMSFTKMLEKIHTKPNHKIDKDFVVRSRAFDMLIGDFDRHDDQWRWARIEEEDFTYYRPIPRDRDQAFFKADGIGLNIAKWRWLLWYTQDFYGGAKDVLGLNSQARHFDRSFLTEADREDWISQAEFIQDNLSDDEIREAVSRFPKEAFEIRGEAIIEGLMIRRDELVDYVKEYYHVLAREVDVVGSYENDFFEVLRKETGQVEVNVYPRENGKKVESERYYHRLFDPRDTKEIRLFGLDGKDEYKIKGRTKESILIRIVAGEEKDKVEDESQVSGMRKMTRVYDLEGKVEIDNSKETKLTTMTPEDMYDYDRLEFKYNMLKPALSLGFNPNDGFYLGPGFDHTIHGFKKSPYKFHHKFLANRTFGVDGFGVYYDFDLVDAIGKGDLGAAVTVNTPLAFSYFGEGREAIVEDEFGYNVLMNNYKLEPTLTFSSENRTSNLVLGLQYNHVNFETKDIPTVEDWEVESQDLVGGKLAYQFLNKDDKLNPHSGMEFSVGGEYVHSLSNDEIDFVRLTGSLSFFIPLDFFKTQTTLALRSGIATNIGDYAFYQSNFLSGYETFRGVRRNRYAGETSQYNNIELRVSLFKVPNYVLPFDVGMMGHFDAARVWTPAEDNWHTSSGGGVYLSAIDAFMLFGTYSVSSEDGLLVIGSKFLF